MSLLSSIDTSQYTTPLTATFVPNQHEVVAELDQAKLETPNVAATDKETPKVDLSNYYSNVRPASPDTADVNNLENGVTQASQNLSNAIAAAVEHGMNPQDAINIQKAKAAYETTMKTSETSTFQIAVE